MKKAQIAAEINNVAEAREQLQKFINNCDRGERVKTQIIKEIDGRGGWELDVIALAVFGSKAQSFSVVFDNDMDVTESICTDVELSEMFERIADAAKVELETFAEQDD